MAKKDVVAQVELSCGGCTRRNYRSRRNRNNMREKLTLKKYCRWCRQHTLHKEV